MINGYGTDSKLPSGTYNETYEKPFRMESHVIILEIIFLVNLYFSMA